MGVYDKYTREQNKTNLKQKTMHLLHKLVKKSVYDPICQKKLKNAEYTHCFKFQIQINIILHIIQTYKSYLD